MNVKWNDKAITTRARRGTCYLKAKSMPFGSPTQCIWLHESQTIPWRVLQFDLFDLNG